MIIVTSKSSNKIFVVKEYKEFLEELKRSNPKLYGQICNKIREIKRNPLNNNFKKLRLGKNYRRARLGKYRIIYFIEEKNILITRIGHRKNVYKKEYTVKNFTINEF